MNEKIGLQDLVVLLAEKANISKKDAETLVKECFDTMEKGLLNDKLLKIRNLGTFKLIRVDDRESVDVSTGERVLIPAHYKVTFSSDVELAEKVNVPYASLEPVEIADDTTGIEDETEDETDDENEDENEEIATESGHFWKEPQKQEEPEIEITKPVREEPEMIEEAEPVVEEVEPMIEKVEPEKPADSVQYDEEYRPVEATNVLFWLFFLIVAALTVFFAGRYFCPMINYEAEKALIPDSVAVFSYSVNKPPVSDSLKAKAQKTDSAALQIADTLNEKAVHTPAEQTSKAQAPTPPKPETVAEPKTQPAVTPKAQTAKNQPVKIYDNRKYRVRRGERLNTIALREYGHKAFWVYIYDENRKAIRNPDSIEPGMVINIPPAGKYGIDKNDRASVNKALELEQKYKP